MIDSLDPMLSSYEYDTEWWERFNRALEQLSYVLEERDDRYHLELSVDMMGQICYELRIEGRVVRNQ